MSLDGLPETRLGWAWVPRIGLTLVLEKQTIKQLADSAEYGTAGAQHTDSLKTNTLMHPRQDPPGTRTRTNQKRTA